MDVAVVITAYRQPGLMMDAVVSALDQKFGGAWGIVIVNDGCPYQETNERCCIARAAWPDRVLYARTLNCGVAAARNAGTELALISWPTLRAVFFLDGDDCLYPWALQRTYDALVATAADWVFTDMTAFGASRQFYGMAGVYSPLEAFIANYMGMASMISRGVLDAGLRFDTAMKSGLEDWDYWLKLARAGFRGAYVPGAGVLYRHRNDSATARVHRNPNCVLSQLYRNNAEWVNPINAVRLEEIEAPRWALVANGSVTLCTDPSRLNHAIPFAAFLEHAQEMQVGVGLPAYLVTSTKAFLRRLETSGRLHGILWDLERRAARLDRPVALVRESGHLRVREGGHSRNAPAHMAMVRLDVALENRTSWAVPSISSERDALFELETALGAFRRGYSTQRGTPPELACNSNFRLRKNLTHAANQLFGTTALFPLSGTDKLRVGFVIVGECDKQSKRHVLAAVRLASDHGCSTHLFWFRDRFSRVGTSIMELFSTVTILSTEELGCLHAGKPSPDLVGLFATLHIVVDHECPEWLALAMELKRWPVTVLYSACARPAGCSRDTISRAILAEPAISAYVTDNEELRVRIVGEGVPSSKVPAEYSGFFRGNRHD
jgi:hypothetical protein